MKKHIYKFIGVGIEMCAIVFLFFFIGFKIDQKMGTGYYIILLSFLGIVCSLFALYRKVKKG
tara:strand:+ start:1497 stop:1682 length:186 start_codon:yes stop_codon:yes gene_type:complete